jgi:hypothetical protein
MVRPITAEACYGGSLGKSMNARELTAFIRVDGETSRLHSLRLRGLLSAAREILGPERTTGRNQPPRTETKCRSFQICWMPVTQAQINRGSLPLKPIQLPQRNRRGTIKPSSRKQAPLQPANQKRLCSLDLLRLEPADKLQSRRPEQQSKRFSSQLGIVAE